MRIVRVAFVLFSALIFFLLLNSVMGKLFPASTPAEGSLSGYGSYYSDCAALQSGSFEGDNTAYNDCIEEGQATYEESVKSRYDQSGKDQIRNIYVVLVVMLVVLTLVGLLHRFLPLLSAAMLMGGIYFTLYFPPSNVVSNWYDSVFSMSDAVRNQLHNTVIIASLIGFLAIVLTSIFSLERKAPSNPPFAGNLG